MFERYLAISLAFRNISVDSIVQIIGRSSTTVYTYINKFLMNGLDGLNRIHSKGRPSYLTDEQKAKVIHTVTHKTPEAGVSPGNNESAGKKNRKNISRKQGTQNYGSKCALATTRQRIA